MPYSFRCSGCGEQLTDDAWDSSAGQCIYCSGAHAASMEPKPKPKPKPTAKVAAEEVERRCPACGGATEARPAPADYRERAVERVCVRCGATS